MLADRGAPVLLTAGAAGRRPAGGPRRGSSALDARRGWHGRRCAAPPAAEPAGEPGLRDVHLGLDRPAQGGGGAAPGVVRLVRGDDYARLRRRTRSSCSWRRIAFDASTLEIWGALLNGGRLVVAAAGRAVARRSWAALLARHGVTTLWLTAGLFHQMVERAA